MADILDAHRGALQRCGPHSPPGACCLVYPCYFLAIITLDLYARRRVLRPNGTAIACAGAGFVPLAEHRGALGAALVVGVAVQEATRLCAWLAHRCAPHCRA